MKGCIVGGLIIMHGHISHDRSLLMRFRLTPKDSSFYELFTTSAEHLIEGSKELTKLLGVERSERCLLYTSDAADE